MTIALSPNGLLREQGLSGAVSLMYWFWEEWPGPSTKSLCPGPRDIS